MNRDRAQTRLERLGGSLARNADGSTLSIYLRGPRFTTIDAACPFRDAERLTIRDTRICDLKGIEHFQRLRELWIDDPRNCLEDVSSLCHLVKLRRLHLECPTITALPVFSQSSELEIAYLVLPNEDLSPLAGLRCLQILAIQAHGPIRDLSVLESAPCLVQLSLEGDNIASLDGLERVSQLRTISISSASLSDISAVCHLPQLEELSLSECHSVRDLPKSIGSIRHLSKVTVFHCEQIHDLTPLGDLAELKEFRFKAADDGPILNLEPLSTCRTLRHVSIWAPIEDLTPFANLTSLRVLEIPGGRYPGRQDVPNGGVRDLSPLHGLKNLEFLDIRGTPALTLPGEVERITAAIPHCRVLFEYDLLSPNGTD